MSDDVLTHADGPVGRIRLNRPRALHALTTEMCTTILDALTTWRTDPTIALVMIDHAPAPDGDPKLSRRMQKLISGGLLVYMLFTTFAAFDWMMSL